MSFNRENVIWQSADGTWSRGFYETCWVGDEYDGYDPEWDVEYGDGLWCVTVGHASEDAAERAWDGANPGGHTTITQEHFADECAALDAEAKRIMALRDVSRGWYYDVSKQG